MKLGSAAILNQNPIFEMGSSVTRFQNDPGTESDAKQILAMRRKRMKVFGIFLAILMLVMMIGTSSAEIYRWVDEKGVVHFSDSPTESMSEADLKEEVSSPDPNPEDNSQPTTETRTITLDPDFFDLLDEHKQDDVTINAPTVEIYETSW